MCSLLLVGRVLVVFVRCSLCVVCSSLRLSFVLCVSSIARCLLFVGRWSLLSLMSHSFVVLRCASFVVRCLLLVVCWRLCVLRCRLSVARLLFVVCVRLLPLVVRCLLLIVRCFAFSLRCVLFVACCFVCCACCALFFVGCLLLVGYRLSSNCVVCDLSFCVC